jgi:hypothetical protein
MSALLKKLVEKTCHYRDVVPVFRIEPRPLDELEGSALRMAAGVAGRDGDAKSRIERRNGRSDVLLQDGVRARVFHASGSLAVSAGLAPMEHLIGEKADKETLTRAAAEAGKRLGLDRFVAPGEQLVFERLWQIKAAGISGEGVRGREVLCRAVGAFRRYLHDLPVWGRASAVVELAGDDRLAGAGVDWRTVAAEPIDRAKVIAPEAAARAVINDLGSRLPGGEFGDDDFDVAMFSLGYLSLPKRRAQSVFAPVYVAMLVRRGWTTTNYVIAVPGSEKVYESVCRPNQAPPRDATKSQPGTGKSGPPRASAWNPLATPPSC